MTINVKDDDDLRAVLDQMGGTDAEVAEYLRAAGVTGMPDNATCCPVANWLLRETGAGEVEVDRHCIQLRFIGPLDEGPPELRVNPPDSVRNFIERFDEGDYPDLEEVSNP